MFCHCPTLFFGLQIYSCLEMYPQSSFNGHPRRCFHGSISTCSFDEYGHP